ncbi:DsbA family oxidoreductase [Halobacillus massiliensis]|uniref:DsbA family oxidoreductase n=1 Tax=Halobacillus massiliensis TaxID=1926286 RepID=UPI0009E5AA2F|nr:DsbA family oxidoreductase [Halobacillus massiliensis]
MKIEIWSDFVCPFCYIGKRKLETALEQLSFTDAEIIYKSFELDPGASKNSGQTIHEKLAEKYGRSIEEAKQMTSNMEQQAAEVGLTFNFDKQVPTNTFDAHQLTKIAESRGLDKEVAEKLFEAVFTKGQDVGNIDILSTIGKSCGLTDEEIRDVLINSKFSAKVREEEMEARQLGVQGVPFFVFNSKYAISGAQPIETFVQSIQKVLEEESEKPVLEDLSSHKGAACTDDNC